MGILPNEDLIKEIVANEERKKLFIQLIELNQIEEEENDPETNEPAITKKFTNYLKKLMDAYGKMAQEASKKVEAPKEVAPPIETPPKRIDIPIED